MSGVSLAIVARPDRVAFTLLHSMAVLRDQLVIRYY